jgi:hypothetical protein
VPFSSHVSPNSDPRHHPQTSATVIAVRTATQYNVYGVLGVLWTSERRQYTVPAERVGECMSRYDVHAVSVKNPEDETTGLTQVIVRHRKENRKRKSKTRKGNIGRQFSIANAMGRIDQCPGRAKTQKAIQKMNIKGISDYHDGRMTYGPSHWHSDRQEASRLDLG